jgi:hypothetical protein
MSLLSKAFLGRVELEWPKEIVGFLEVRAHSGDFMDNVLNTHESTLSKLRFNDAVISQRDSGTVDLSVASLVNKFGNGSLGWITISNVWLNSSEHVNCSLVESDEHSVVQLSQSQKLHDLFACGVQLVDTK